MGRPRADGGRQDGHGGHVGGIERHDNDIQILRDQGMTSAQIGYVLGLHPLRVMARLVLLGEADAAGKLKGELRGEGAAAILDASTDPLAKIEDIVKASGLPVATVRAFMRRLKKDYGEVPAVVKEFKAAHFVAKLGEKIDLALDHIDEQVLQEASFRDLSMGASMMLEKMQLMKGEPTAIISDHERAKIHELLPILIAEAKRRGLTIEGSAVLVGNTA